MKVPDADRRNEDNRGCIRHRSTASFFRRRGQHNSARRCSCSADPCPTSASPRHHLKNVEIVKISDAATSKVVSHSLEPGQGQTLLVAINKARECNWDKFSHDGPKKNNEMISCQAA